MIESVHSLAEELRRMRIPIATSDLVDAISALEVTDLLDRGAVHASLAACLAKSADHRDAFDVLFDLYFADAPLDAHRSLAGLDDAALTGILLVALEHHNAPLLRQIAAEAVDRFARIVPGRSVAGTYYVFRTVSALGGADLAPELELAMADRTGDGPLGTLARAVRHRRAVSAVQAFERTVESEVRRRLVAERGADDVAVSLRNPLPEDSDFLTASIAAVERMGDAVEPLGRRLARLLIESHRSARHRRIDMRATLRASLSTGGTPVTIRYLPPTPPKPRLVVLADISGSVASFAAFALQLTFALRSQFSSLRSFVFVDGIDEVTDIVGSTRRITETTQRINTERRGVALDGHSDYGNAFAEFVEKHLDAIDTRTTVLVLGDARNNYRDPRTDSLALIRARAASLYWLNPERRTVWGDGDSIVHEYAAHCDDVTECRTIRQLESFVSTLA